MREFSKKVKDSDEYSRVYTGKLLGLNIKYKSDELKSLSKCILDTITFYKKADKPLYKKHMEVVLLNLLRCKNKEVLYYSRDLSKGFTKSKRYNPKQLSVRVLIKVIDLLEDNGFLINTIGKASRKEENRMPSFIQPTDLFLDTFSDLDVLSESVEEQYLNNEECFILRDEHKGLVDYRDTYYTKMGRAVVVGLNSINRQFEYRSGDGELITNHYCRIFNEDFTKGGRFYRAGILQLKNKGVYGRLKVTCSGEPMVEVDYCNLHILLLTILEGFQYLPDVDLYNKCIPEGWVNSNTRGLVKTATNIMLNAKTTRSASEAIQHLLEDYLAEFPKDFPDNLNKAKQVMDWIRDGHPKLKKYFCSLESTGLTLMKMDSDMAHHVIHCFVSKEKPILPVHDSFLVRRSDKEDLIESMVEALKVVTEREDLTVPLSAEWWDKDYGHQSEKFLK
ncbi:hypothetical protein KUA24_65 [Vibrio phage HNL01]|nr:hypothetical protein KUA24_65 [Vibrio phage HNL01]